MQSRRSGIRVDCLEVEERRVGHRSPAVRICNGRRRIEGDQKQEQPTATGGVRATSASSLARTHGLSSGRGLDFCQSALSGQDSLHLSDSFPASHPSRDRENLWDQEQQGSPDWMAHATPVASDLADLQRGECESRTITASSHNPKDHPGALRTSGFRRSARSPQEGRANGSSGGLLREAESTERYRNRVESRVSRALGVRGCPKPTLPKSAKYFEILVSAAGLEPAPHALKGHCSTNGAPPPRFVFYQLRVEAGASVPQPFRTPQENAPVRHATSKPDGE